MATHEAQARKLIEVCEKSMKDPRHEYRTRRVRGVSMTYSDVEVAILYGQTILKEGHYCSLLMQPRSAVRELIEKFGLLEGEETSYA